MLRQQFTHNLRHALTVMSGYAGLGGRSLEGRGETGYAGVAIDAVMGRQINPVNGLNRSCHREFPGFEQNLGLLNTPWTKLSTVKSDASTGFPIYRSLDLGSDSPSLEPTRQPNVPLRRLAFSTFRWNRTWLWMSVNYSLTNFEKSGSMKNFS